VTTASAGPGQGAPRRRWWAGRGARGGTPRERLGFALLCAVALTAALRPVLGREAVPMVAGSWRASLGPSAYAIDVPTVTPPAPTAGGVPTVTAAPIATDAGVPTITVVPRGTEPGVPTITPGAHGTSPSAASSTPSPSATATGTLATGATGTAPPPGTQTAPANQPPPMDMLYLPSLQGREE